MATRPSLPRGCQRDRGDRWAVVHDCASNYLVPVVPARTGVPGRTLRLVVAAAWPRCSARCCSAPARRGAQQASLVESSPADGAELDAPPSQIVLTFDSELGDANRCRWRATATRSRPISRPVLSDDGRTLTVDVPEPMPAGECNVAWRSASRPARTGATDRFSFAVLSSTAVDPTATHGARRRRRRPTAPARRRRQRPTTTTRWSSTTPPTCPTGRRGSAGCCRRSASPCCSARSSLIVVAWPEGPEYILAVRFLRSVWLLTLAGTLLYVVALSAAVNDESFGSGLNPAGWLDLLDAGWPGRAALARLVLVVACVWVVLRPGAGHRPDDAAAGDRHPDAGRHHDRAGADRRRPRHPRRRRRHRPRPGDGGLGRRRRAAGPRRARRTRARRTSSTPCAGSAASPARRSCITVVSGLVQLYRLDGGSLFSESHGRVLLAEDGVRRRRCCSSG